MMHRIVVWCTLRATMAGSTASTSSLNSNPDALVSEEVLYMNPAISMRLTCDSCGHVGGGGVVP